jgi:3-hydroxyisobutyrate dehydrogenase-like beta-hydroxyacid dehydrogenase
LTTACQLQKISLGDKKMAKVAFLGLGVMGYPMAGHLLKKGGHDVTVYNRSAAKAQQWVKEYGGKSAATPAEAARTAISS